MYPFCLVEKFMLNDASGLKHGGHHGEVAADVDQGAIGEEEIGVAPEAVGELVMQLFHLLGAVLAVFLL